MSYHGEVHELPKLADGKQLTFSTINNATPSLNVQYERQAKQKSTSDDQVSLRVSFGSDLYSTKSSKSNNAKSSHLTSSPSKRVHNYSYDEIVHIDLVAHHSLSEWAHYFDSIEQVIRRYYNHPEKIYANWNTISTLRQVLEEVAKNILLKSVSTYSKGEFDQRTWKYGFYECIDVLRLLYNRSTCLEKPVAEGYFSWINERALDYFKQILNILDSKYDVNVKKLVALRNSSVKRTTAPENHHAANSVFKIHIFVGDIYRYIGSSTSLRQSHESYELARQIHPNRGRPYSQLALVALARSDMISRVYYITRSMVAKYPVEGSRNQLHEIYDGVYKTHRAEAKNYWCYRSKLIELPTKWHVRKEVWIHPTLEKPEEPVYFAKEPQTKKQHVDELSHNELFHRFSITYNLLLGKLFTKIGVDKLESVAEEALVYFEVCLKKGIRMKFHRLMQIATLNIYIIDHLQNHNEAEAEHVINSTHLHKDALALISFRHLNATGHKAQSEFLENVAMQFFFELFSLVVERLTELIELLQWDSPLIQPYAAFVMICCEWLAMTPEGWIKPHRRPTFCIRRIEKLVEDNDENRMDDVWIVFANLMSRLSVVFSRHQNFLFPSVKKQKDDLHTRRLTPLPECVTIEGFPCLQDSAVLKKDFYATNFRSRTRGQNFVRLKSIFRFGRKYLVEYSVIKSFKTPSGLVQYSSITKLQSTKMPADKCGLDVHNLHYWTYKMNEETSVAVKPPKWPDCNHARIVVRKIKTKPVVSSTIMPPIMSPMPMHEVFKRFYRRGFRTDIIVRPKRIVLDTNCFILHLRHVILLTKLVDGPLLVPVSVILELKGLQKGGFTNKDRKKFKSESDPGAAEKLADNLAVAEVCKLALKFIDSNLRRKFLLISCFGRIMEDTRSIYEKILDDQYDPKKTNDERILDACFYLESNDERLRAKDRPHRIYRDTVILTSDRMMRVGSFDYDIPARHITPVTFWAYRVALENGQFKKALHRSQSIN